MKKLFLALIFTFTFVIPALADGPWIDDDSLDAALSDIANNGDYLFVGTDGTWANRLGSVATTPGDGNGDYTIGNGAIEGRSLSIAAQTITATGTGTADTWGIYDNDNAEVKAYGNLSASVSMVSGNVYDFGTLTDAININDPD